MLLIFRLLCAVFLISVVNRGQKQGFEEDAHTAVSLLREMFQFRLVVDI